MGECVGEGVGVWDPLGRGACRLMPPGSPPALRFPGQAVRNFLCLHHLVATKVA